MYVPSIPPYVITYLKEFFTVQFLYEENELHNLLAGFFNKR